KGFQPRGKQSLNPHGIWYTASSGIWQTVWLEPVAQVAVKDLKMVPDIDNKTLQLQVDANTNSTHYEVQAVASFDGKNVSKTKGVLGEKLTLPVNNMKLWSPQHPFLYDLKVAIYKEGEKIDEVQSYFGMRKISLGKDEEGITRIFLNNKPLFQFGPLDQGYWPDGLYTAPTDEAMKFDILKTKAWGFNMIRKHVKVEPRRWYYYCDKIGLLVWQDMPSGDKRISRKQKDIKRVAQSAHDFKKELKQMIDDRYNHPSIVTWVPFNEGWGQFQTKEVAKLVADLDPSRLVDAPSGWADRGVGDMHDLHEYPGPGMFPIEDGRASVLGEYGGQALVVKGHLWLKDFSKAPKHYKTSTSDKALHEKYASMIDSLKVLKKKGLSAAVYTQTTDVEVEVNGLMTYDREEMKFDEDELKKMNQEVIHEE
ncbi:MAG TPA: glycoside hydrolase family 2 TIM barrel-domain containing protein, partial [Chitinophagaceae bacterium]|nr:glycoside hydrolase family 2 TIM barrel-domain containing protein [Chitinophagaceae bacterium]